MGLAVMAACACSHAQTGLLVHVGCLACLGMCAALAAAAASACMHMQIGPLVHMGCTAHLHMCTGQAVVVASTCTNRAARAMRVCRDPFMRGLIWTCTCAHAQIS